MKAVAMLVLDASVALAWCFEDASSAVADRALEQLIAEGAVVPAIWPLEMANALRSAERRGRLTVADHARLRDLLVALPVTVEAIDLAGALGEVSEIARAAGLSAYDAAYLALAARRELPLATTDARLASACTAVGVAVVG
jgi:predicted nucleic acid-binding protein